jgi:ATP-dependent RNA helicase DeaD
MPRILTEFEDLSKEDFIRRFASIEFNRFLEYYKNAPDLNANMDTREGVRGERGERPDRRDGDSTSERFGRSGSKGDFTRLFINLGSVDDLTRGDLLRLICDNANIDGGKVGKIDLKGVYSFFEVENDLVNKVFEGFKEVEHSNRKVRIEVSQDGDKRREERRGGGSFGGGGGSGFGGKRRSFNSGGDRGDSGSRPKKPYRGGERGDRF